MSDATALAEIHLYGLIAEAHDPDRRGEEDGRRRFEAALDAAIAVGLAAPQQRDEWLARYERHAELLPPAAADVPMERAFALLDRLGQDAREPNAPVAAHIRFQDARTALIAIGALDRAEGEWWTRHGLLDQGDLEEGGYEPESRLIGLLAAFPGDPAADAANGVVTSVECYEDGIVVHWRLRRSEPLDLDTPAGEERDYDDLDIAITDDAGNEYWSRGGGSGSGIREVHGNSQFAPGVAREARTLRVAWAGGRLELDVGDVWTREPV